MRSWCCVSKRDQGNIPFPKADNTIRANDRLVCYGKMKKHETFFFYGNPDPREREMNTKNRYCPFFQREPCGTESVKQRMRPFKWAPSNRSKTEGARDGGTGGVDFSGASGGKSRPEKTRKKC